MLLIIKQKCKVILFVVLFFLLNFTNICAHNPSHSSTMLVEGENNEWTLLISSSLTAFQHEIRRKYSIDSYKTPEEFKALVVKHLLESISISFDQKAEVKLEKLALKLGHGTKVSFKLIGMPNDFDTITVINTSFENLSSNQSALLIFKKGIDKEQFILNRQNKHSLKLLIKDSKFNIITKKINKRESRNYILWGSLTVFSVLALFVLGLRRKTKFVAKLLSMNKIKIFSIFLFGVLVFASCSNDDDITAEEEEELIVVSEDEETTYLITEDLFNTESLVSFEKITATLEDGTSATCFQITFSSNPLEEVGPFCPDTKDDVAGLGFYDGATNPGLRVWNIDLLDDIEADGYDMVDEDGNVNVDEFDGDTDSSLSYCLEAPADDDLQLTFIIPAEPKLADSNNDIEEVELVGVSIDGIPINGEPPSAINGPVQLSSNSDQINFPSLDPCGGHHDPAGYYHWHFIAEIMNQVLEENGITEVSCTNVTQITGIETKLVGFAKDGYPIYAYGEEPSDLDDCGGRTATTNEYPEGTYHYVASTTSTPNIPVCLKGVAARNSFSYR